MSLTKKEILISINKELDKAQKLADRHSPILGEELADHFNYTKLLLQYLKELK